MARSAPEVIALLRRLGHRMTPQRQAIVEEVMRARGHITPLDVARVIKRRLPAVNASTVYRTMGLLEDVGVLSHSHLESGAGYHRRGEGDHVHITCTHCGEEDDLSLDEAGALREVIRRHRGFAPDLTHFAIAGACARCQRAGRASRRPASRRAPRRAPARRPAPPHPRAS